MSGSLGWQTTEILPEGARFCSVRDTTSNIGDNDARIAKGQLQLKIRKINPTQSRKNSAAPTQYSTISGEAVGKKDLKLNHKLVHPIIDPPSQ